MVLLISLILKDVKPILFPPGLGLAGLTVLGGGFEVLGTGPAAAVVTAGTAAGIGTLVACINLSNLCTHYANGLAKLKETKKEELKLLQSKIEDIKIARDKYEELKEVCQK